MIGVLLILVFAAADAAKLNNSYLPPPPPRGQLAGGSDGALEVPLEPPYIDSYTPTEQPNLKDDEEQDDVQEDNELPPLPKHGKFLSGSYTYTGPDNVLVTVTFKANEKESRSFAVDDENNEKPLSLPKDLTRALDFSKDNKRGGNVWGDRNFQEQHPEDARRHELTNYGKSLPSSYPTKPTWEGRNLKDKNSEDQHEGRKAIGKPHKKHDSPHYQESTSEKDSNAGYYYSKPTVHQGYSRYQ